MTLGDVRHLGGWFVHLRLGFQVFLSPIFLFGFLIAGGHINRDLVLGYLAFHVFGYGGGTAFNSYYDRDTGPIGGLEHPPPIPRGLLAFSILWQLIGFAIALAVNLSFAAIYAIMFWMSVGYSHPRTRFKGHALAALATVAIGQGVFGYLGGWACARGELVSALTLPGLLGATAATLLTVGFYPLTGIYQIEEDRARGDQTLPVWLGPAKSFRFAFACLLLGGIAAIALIVMQFQIGEALFLAVILAGLLFAVWRWSRTFQQAAIIQNFRTIMRLYALTSLGFIAWIWLHLIGFL
ncbi:MAG: UbiA family prenyltransferase [Chloroflexi bacterium]|nr:UbiA family prenyltransferase [Chloroflexota bacterium]